MWDQRKVVARNPKTFRSSTSANGSCSKSLTRKMIMKLASNHETVTKESSFRMAKSTEHKACLHNGRLTSAYEARLYQLDKLQLDGLGTNCSKIHMPVHTQTI